MLVTVLTQGEAWVGDIVILRLGIPKHWDVRCSLSPGLERFMHYLACAPSRAPPGLMFIGKPMKKQQSLCLSRLCVVLGLSGAALLAGCGGKEGGATQVAAKVNDKELTVHQINFVLQQSPQMAAAAGSAAPRQVLERLIDQEVILQQALDQKLDRDPNVVSAIEAAKRDIIARAYMDQLAAKLPAPTPQDVQSYFDSKPELFSQRQVYNLTEIQLALQADQAPEVQALLQAGKSAEAVVQWAQDKQLRVALNHVTRPAEGLPLSMLPQLAKVAPGQGVMLAEGGVARILYVDSRRAEPVTLDQARNAIQSAIANERKRQAMQDEVRRLRTAAKVAYEGAFAASAPAAGDAPAAPATNPAPAEAASPAASAGLDDATLKKGLGLK